MDDFHLEATERTPEITLSPKEGVFVIKGESFPEDVASFYGKLINNIDSLKDLFSSFPSGPHLVVCD